MSSIGIIGGIGYKATAYFYQKINALYEQKKGKGNSCPILLVSLNFKEINSLLPYEMEKVAELITPTIKYLDQQEITCAILINNTMHKALDIVLDNNETTKPFFHVGNLINQKLNEVDGISNIIILGTAFTMQDEYLKSFVPKKHNLITPSDEIIEQVNELRKVYFDSTDEEKTNKCYQLLTESYSENVIFIVACTELSIAFSNIKNKTNWVDTIDLQCKAALKTLKN
ncbi:aspartate/glutamate racemase family protein [uncultured Flavobacterium sp.]|uniref:aspartate/glutamate racemase family protein n=1 Tax=uncultured Flavobacterium sp. TaxID=165435 RepID=UPI0030EC64BA|tara:strand:+ start:3347 stop:4030 length:684 start_codon:yes stop_codon:yes gene_type:complete